MVLHLVRAFFLLMVLAVTVSFAFLPSVYSTGQNFITLYILIPIVIALALVVVDTFWHRKRLQLLSGLFFGVLAGLAIAYMLSLIVDLVVSLVPTPPVAENPGTLQEWQSGRVAQAPIGREKTTEQEFIKAFQKTNELLGLLYSSTTRPAAAHEPEATPATAAISPAEASRSRQQVGRYMDDYEAAVLAYRAYDGHIKMVQMIKLLLGTAAVFLCVTFVLQTKDDFRFVIPYVEFSKQTKGARPLLLDTSVIIDGRIADIADTRILESEIIVPRFVLAELQAVADSDDKLKRNRGRRGLDVLNRLQSSDKIDIQLLDARVASVAEALDVDAKLVALAKHLEGRIVTNDYNLNKVAQLRGVDVININDLANALKPIVLPGETLLVKIIKPGEEAGQGVGYLEDGTMVVAEHGRDSIGKEIVITVTSVLQTSAGRMIFGRLDDRSYSRRDAASPSASAAAHTPHPPAGGPRPPSHS